MAYIAFIHIFHIARTLLGSHGRRGYTEWSKHYPTKFREWQDDFYVTGRMAVHQQAALPGRIEWRQIQIGRNIFAQLCVYSDGAQEWSPWGGETGNLQNHN